MEEIATGYGLVEAPVWAQGRGLFFSDVLGGGVYRLGLDGASFDRDPEAPRRRRHGAAREPAA